MEAYREFIRLKSIFGEFPNVLYESGHLWEERIHEQQEFEKRIFNRDPISDLLDKSDNRTFLNKKGVLFVHKCFKEILQSNLDQLLDKKINKLKSEDLIRASLKRYKILVDQSELFLKIDEETYTILEKPETLVDGYFYSLRQIVKDSSESEQSDLQMALKELNSGNVEGCFSLARRFTDALRDNLKKQPQDTLPKELPLNNTNFKAFFNALYGILSGAVKNQKPKDQWTIDEARFLLRIAIALQAYYEKIDSKIATQKEQFEEPLF